MLVTDLVICHEVGRSIYLLEQISSNIAMLLYKQM